MGKYEVYEALKFLGGHGTTEQIKSYLANKYPDYSYSEYATKSLRQLVNDHSVSYDYDTDSWTIIDEFGDRNVVQILPNGRVRRLS